MRSSRYTLRRQLGTGAYGEVYEAHDAIRGESVALKTLSHLDGTTLHALKREFRALADLRHDNLVRYHDLIEDEGTWFVTMDLIHGTDFMTWVRGQLPQGRETWDGERTKALAPDARVFDEDRLRVALGGLCAGIAALHTAGRVHRDLKPSNVLVEGSGRTVILDFGLATEASERGSLSIAGTPAYMAPEALTPPVGPEADAYAIGVMLYEALTGRVPFQGSPRQVLILKGKQRPDPPTMHASGVPEDLEQLCMALLAPEPSERPTAAEVLDQLGTAVAWRPSSSTGGLLFGREEETAALSRARQPIREGRPAVVIVRGPGGVGKTTLLRSFAATLQQEQPRAIVLASRCHPRESLPFKGLDGLIDELAGALLAIPRDEASAVLPREADALARIFPVLRRVPAFHGAPATRGQEVRERATTALGELFARIADRRPLLAVIDDAQWGDGDSGKMLARALATGGAAMTLLVAWRDDEPEGPLVHALRTADRAVIEPTEVLLGPLPADATRQLATQRAAQLGLPVDAPFIDALCEDAEGNPAFVEEWLQHRRRGGEPVGSVDELIRSRAAMLDEAHRDALSRAVVSRCDLPLDLAHAEGPAIDALQDQRLARVLGDPPRLVPWHDRVRTAILRGIEPALVQRLHTELASAWEARVDGDPGVIGGHFEAAGTPDRAAPYLLAAGVQAESVVAYARAADHYQRSIDTGGLSESELAEAWQGLARSFAALGQRTEAAGALEQAVPYVPDAEGLNLKVRAAEYLVRVGHMDRGLDAFRAVAQELGVVWPRTNLGAILRLLFDKVRPVRPSPQHPTQQLELTQALVAALQYFSPPLAAWFQVHHVRCLETRADATAQNLITVHAGSLEAAMYGKLAHPIESKRQGIENAVRAHPEDPSALHTLVTLQGQSIAAGRWKEALRYGEWLRDLRARLGQKTLLDDDAQLQLTALFYLGRLDDMVRARAVALERATVRGERYVTGVLRTGYHAVARLLRGEPLEEVRRDVELSADDLPMEHELVQLGMDLLGRTAVFLAMGDARGALRVVDERRLRWRMTYHLIHVTRVEALFTEARCLAAIAVTDPRTLGRLRRTVKRLFARRNGFGFALGHAHLSRAMLRALEGGDPVPDLNAALTVYDAQDMGLHASVVRLQLARWGQPERASEAEAWVEEQGVVDVELMLRLMAPMPER